MNRFGMQGPFVTVLTPTYNRAGLLPRVYQSLLAQTQKRFEWVIVDDGFTDGTRDLVREWVGRSPFPVRYLWQENSGKHVAVNRGVALAQGDLVLILDSDDRLVPNAIERVRYWWNTIPDAQRVEFAGVAGLCAFPSGHLVGTPFPKEILDSNPIEIRVRYKVRGDKCEVWRTDIAKLPVSGGFGAICNRGSCVEQDRSALQSSFCERSLENHGISARWTLREESRASRGFTSGREGLL